MREMQRYGKNGKPMTSVEEKSKDVHISGRYAILAALIGGFFTIAAIWYTNVLGHKKPEPSPAAERASIPLETWFNLLDESRPELADSILQYLPPSIPVINYEKGLVFEEGMLDHFLQARMIDPHARPLQIINKDEMTKNPSRLEIQYFD